MTKIDNLKHFMARRKWGALEAMYNVTAYTMMRCIRDNERPAALTPDQWEEVIHYREEWHKANDELRRLREQNN